MISVALEHSYCWSSTVFSPPLLCLIDCCCYRFCEKDLCHSIIREIIKDKFHWSQYNLIWKFLAYKLKKLPSYRKAPPSLKFAKGELTLEWQVSKRHHKRHRREMLIPQESNQLSTQFNANLVRAIRWYLVNKCSQTSKDNIMLSFVNLITHAYMYVLSYTYMYALSLSLSLSLPLYISGHKWFTTQCLNLTEARWA